MSIHSSLLQLRQTPFILDALRSADDFADSVDRFGHESVSVLTELINDESDALTAITAVHALARVYDDEAERVLSDLLSSDRAFLREHAAWAFWTRLPRLDAVSRLVAGVISGGFTGALAQRTLQQWAQSTPDHVALALEGALMGQSIPAARARLAETLGLIPGRVAGRALCFIATDDAEALPVRIAAMAALGDRNIDNEALHVVERFAELPGELGDVARLAAYDIEVSLNPPVRLPGGPDAREGAARSADASGGLTVAQLFLHADIDRGLTRAGAGDNGGIATLLVRLGDALAAEPGISRVITMSRGSAAAALAVLPDPDYGSNTTERHILAPIPLLSDPWSTASAWPTRVAAERGIRRALLALGPVDVLHLRMAEVGSMAAAAVAERLDIPVVFTLAPDPHAVIHALDMSGALTRRSFGEVDEHEHYWFRTRLVQRLARQAAHTVLFPRPDLSGDLSELLGIDIGAEPEQYTVVPEGIDVSVIEAGLREARAALHVRSAPHGADTGSDSATAVASTPQQLPTGNAFAQLDALVGALPKHRHGLPVALSVGRLHHVKGMATIVEAWAADPILVKRSNLVLVGGDLDDPSADEQGQLDRIEATLAAHPEARDGLILAGHRPNDVVSRWLAAVRFGRPGLIGERGVYVCGSLKEEFGIALLEALAAGLVVVAPDGGGPATYVKNRITGFLVDTRSPLGIRQGLRDALALAHINTALENDDARVDRAQSLIREHFTIGAMAHALTGVYLGVAERANRTGRVGRARSTGGRTGRDAASDHSEFAQ
ncbi:glycosyltransferase [Subtercola vilae]|uniref:Glycosyltransferase n=2 Tax=Subtercola vilae TaxID=2056433 RepID=A0A4T2CED5_9MICO|nr:glycosyltransferase [Subtercola vilae]TIH40896.1 glycosyltransferase [Subtercola vilae]